MDLDSLITECARELGVPPKTLTKWRQRGVSFRRREDIRELASRRGIEIPREAFDFFGRKQSREGA
jgi:hypothetical protein